ncbi:TRAP transporter small permease [Thioalkalivibrio sp. HK1]|uniref:TRAP transporter small permease n=1 Tax=Thioalkalivibrio sp. HK1 TaxID=1469245 RepID=UPI0009DDE44E|nr:TRAP transporter small permease [Thioalkalivibrio sp. HK1]
MGTIGDWVRRAENVVSFFALILLTGSVLWGVLTRYITERPAVWTTELSGILFTWVVFIGAMTAWRSHRHIKVTLLTDLLPCKLRTIVSKIGDGIVFAFLAFVTYLSFSMMLKGASRPSPVLDIPFSYVYLATFICFAGMSITSLLRLLDRPGFADPEKARASDEAL